jgi:hypothetical protein
VTDQGAQPLQEKILQEPGDHGLYLPGVFGVELLAQAVGREVQQKLSELEIDELHPSEVDEVLAQHLLLPLLTRCGLLLC